MMMLTEELSTRITVCVLKGLQKEYPNVLEQTTTIQPSSLHPIFFGCYDWHSSVHSYWTLLMLLKIFPCDLSIRAFINETFTEDNLDVEIATIGRQDDQWECPYGLSWFMLLSHEIINLREPLPRPVLDKFEVLQRSILSRICTWMHSLQEPKCGGNHSNTAFSLSLLMDYCERSSNEDLKMIIVSKTIDLFPKPMLTLYSEIDTGYSFLSPNLCMLDILSKAEKMESFRTIINEIDLSKIVSLAPVEGDPDPKDLCHLIGLNFARSWCYSELIPHVSADLRPIFYDKAKIHIESSLPMVSSGYWMGDHWTCTFLLRALLAFDKASEHIH